MTTIKLAAVSYNGQYLILNRSKIYSEANGVRAQRLH